MARANGEEQRSLSLSLSLSLSHRFPCSVPAKVTGMPAAKGSRNLATSDPPRIERQCEWNNDSRTANGVLSPSRETLLSSLSTSSRIRSVSRIIAAFPVPVHGVGWSRNSTRATERRDRWISNGVRAGGRREREGESERGRGRQITRRRGDKGFLSRTIASAAIRRFRCAYAARPARTERVIMYSRSAPWVVWWGETGRPALHRHCNRC